MYCKTSSEGHQSEGAWVIDYAHAAFFLHCGASVPPLDKAAARAAFATSGFHSAQSLLTDYRYGAKPVISFETQRQDGLRLRIELMGDSVVFGFRVTRRGQEFSR